MMEDNQPVKDNTLGADIPPVEKPGRRPPTKKMIQYFKDHGCYPPPAAKEYIEFPETTELKEELAEQHPLIKEIDSYVGSQERLFHGINERVELIEKKNQKIAELLLEIYNLKHENQCLQEELRGLMWSSSRK